MLDTFIKNRGSTKTIIHDRNHNDFSQVNWDADYDGDIANVSLDFNQNGINEHYDVKLDNNDLAKILNVPSVNLPLDKRLSRDFKKRSYRNTPRPKPYFIEMEPPKLIDEPFTTNNRLQQMPLIESSRPFYTHVSSPRTNEELLIPLTIGKSSRRYHKKPYTHKTHKVYRHIKSSRQNSSRRSKNSSRKSSRRSSRKTF